MHRRRTFAEPARQGIDQARLWRIRIARGFSARRLATESGVGIAIYGRLEDGDNPDLSTISVASLVRIADHLRVPIGDLFTQPDQTNSERVEDPDSDADDSAALGRLLHAIGTQANLVAVADSLGWTQERLQAAIDTLDHTLKPAGLLLFRESGRIQIRARDEVDRAAERRFREHPRATASQRLVTPLRAKMLARAHTQPIGRYVDTQRQADEVNLLFDLGLFVADEEGQFLPAPDVTYSLYPSALDHPRVPSDEPTTSEGANA